MMTDDCSECIKVPNNTINQISPFPFTDQNKEYNENKTHNINNT